MVSSVTDIGHLERDHWIGADAEVGMHSNPAPFPPGLLSTPISPDAPRKVLHGEVGLMKRAIILAVLFTAMSSMAQEAAEFTKITVKRAEVNNGVVIVTAHRGVPGSAKEKAMELQCNKDMGNCSVPAPGEYVMVRLPKNHGVYDCVNVDIYRGSSSPESKEIFGEYCLNEK